jgi:hypothetical protein
MHSKHNEGGHVVPVPPSSNHYWSTKFHHLIHNQCWSLDIYINNKLFTSPFCSSQEKLSFDCCNLGSTCFLLTKENLIYKFTTSVRACVCRTRQFRVLIRRQNRPGQCRVRVLIRRQNRPGQSDSENGIPKRELVASVCDHWTQRKVTGKR